MSGFISYSHSFVNTSVSIYSIVIFNVSKLLKTFLLPISTKFETIPFPMIVKSLISIFLELLSWYKRNERMAHQKEN